MLIGLGVVSVLALGVTSVYSPKLALEALLAGGFVALAFCRLPVALAVFTVLTFPAHLPGSLGAGPTLAKPLGVLLALAWVAAVLSRGTSRFLPRDHPVFFWIVTAFLILAASSTLWAPDLGEAHYQLGRLVQVIVLMLVIYTATSTLSAFRLIVWAYLIASCVTAAYSAITHSYQQGRLSGIFDPNYFAAELIPAIIIGAFLLFTAASKRVRLGAGIVVAVDLLAFGLTQSRGGVVGLAAGLVAAIAVAGRARPRIVVAVLVVVSVGLAYYVAFAPSHLHFGGSSSGRSDEWRIALRMFGNHVWNGVGLGNFIVLEPSYATSSINLNFVHLVVTTPLVVHNTYLELAAELGLAGLGLFLAILVIALRAGTRALRPLVATGDVFEFYARGIVAGAIGMFFAYIFLSAQYEKQLWLMLGLLLILPAVAEQLPRRYDASPILRQ